jgi:hypothetical protein
MMFWRFGIAFTPAGLAAVLEDDAPVEHLVDHELGNFAGVAV